jgi:hypothetical protein
METTDEEVVRQYLGRYGFEEFFVLKNDMLCYYEKTGKVMYLVIENEEMDRKCVSILRSLGREFNTLEEARGAFVKSGGIPWSTE